MENKDLSKEIAKGIVATGVEGGYDAVSCSTAGDYPSLGVSQWEGIGGRGDTLLSYIDGGDRFIGRSYSDIVDSGELQDLKDLISSEQGQAAQLIILAQDAEDSYVDAVSEGGLTDPRCIIYAGIWCPTSHYVVSRFLARRSANYNLNDLEILRDVFRDQYCMAAQVGDEYAEGYANRAENTYEYCANLNLSEYGC